MYKCKLKIEGLDRKLSNNDGINVKDLIELLTKLVKCFGNNASQFTLIDIENSSYTPTLDTSSEECVDVFNEIHENVAKNNLRELSKDLKDYATTLDKVLFDRGLYITAINTRDEREIELKGISKPQIKPYYFTVNSVTGKIQSLYGKVENNPHILIKTSNGYEHSIYVNPDQEIKLSSFYKGANVRFRVRSKIDTITGKSLQTNLIDFTPLNENNFYESITHIKNQFGDIFKSIEDSAALLQSLRNG